MSRHFCRALHFFRLIKYLSTLRGIWCRHHMPWCQSEYASWDFWEASFENMQRCNCSPGTAWLYEVKFNVSAWQMHSIWKISSLAQLVFHEITIKPNYFKSIVSWKGPSFKYTMLEIAPKSYPILELSCIVFQVLSWAWTFHIVRCMDFCSGLP